MSEYPVGRRLASASRGRAFGVVAVTYVLAVLAGWATVALLGGWHPLHSFFWADLVATVVVFAASMLFGNSSLYDPYWSVIPPLIAAGWLLSTTDTLNVRQVILLALMTVWAVRLTANWAIGWSGLSHEDWRYAKIRADTTGRVPWWLASFISIHLVPTLFVYLGLLAVWPSVTGHAPFGWLDVLAIVVTAGAIGLETLSDVQLHRFTAERANRGKVADVGLWRHSRHPNYLGEISFWWGLWLFGLAAAPGWWWTVIGPLAMTGLFVGVSIPMMEARSLARRPAYASYQKQVPMLFPGPRRS
jgi:steroid 5-alpha reductase family enzyme